MSVYYLSSVVNKLRVAFKFACNLLDRTCPSTHTSWWPIRLQAGQESNRALPAIPDDMTWFSDGLMILTSLSSVGWWSIVNTRLGVPKTSLHAATYSGIDNFEWWKKAGNRLKLDLQLSLFVNLDFVVTVCENGRFSTMLVSWLGGVPAAGNMAAGYWVNGITASQEAEEELQKPGWEM